MPIIVRLALDINGFDYLSLVGYFLDFIFIIGLLSVIRSKLVGWPMLAAFSIIYMANLEHTDNFGVTLNMVNVIRHEIDTTFIAGSLELNTYICIILLLSAIYYHYGKWENVKYRYSVFIPIVVLINMVANDWRLENPIAKNIGHLISVPFKNDKSTPEIDYSFLIADLPGVPNVKTPKTINPANVLLILSESISQSYFDGTDKEIDLKKWRRLSHKGITYTNHWALQRGTNRGTYSILCGDYPSMMRREHKSHLMVDGKLKRTCLPEFLRSKGYHTEYIQAASLSFNRKDEFIPKVGFDRYRIDFRDPLRRNGWGVDDRTLFNKAYERIEEIKSPWFMTVLNVGTHHPFNDVPENYRSDDDDRVNSYNYLDDNLDEFVRKVIKSHGDNTLIIMTADEPGKKTDFTNIVDSFRVPLTVIAPDQPNKFSDDTFIHSDLALSITDYLRFNDSPFTGRSIFRTYKRPRDVLVGDRWSGSVSMKADGHDEVSCSSNFVFCQGDSDQVDKMKQMINTIDVTDINSETRVCEPLRATQIVAHAGGKYSNKIYTNSIEALEESYQAGIKYFEVDFDWTTDDRLVLIHDWTRRMKDLFSVDVGRRSLDEFLSLRMGIKARPATPDDLSSWLYRRRDASIITDVKFKNVEGLRILRKYKNYDQFIPQFYHRSRYRDVRELGFKRMIFTLYKSGGFKDNFKNFILDNHKDLFAVTVSRASLMNHPDNFKALRDNDITVFTHPINDVCSAQYMLNNGISKVYSHSLRPEVTH
jgi:glycerophosphoryl diester phosphodiesterase